MRVSLRSVLLLLAVPVVSCLLLAATSDSADSSLHAPASQAAAAACPKCGTERWDVKTLSDPDANQVNFTPKTATVKQLYSMAAPRTGETRQPAEDQTYVVHARLVGYKIEFDANDNSGDHDFHIVIQDLKGSQTMVVEIPDPQCEGVCSSLKKDAIAQARTAFANGVTQQPEAEFFALKTPVLVDVTGVLFFDFAHGQTGLAKNCVELHPVLDFKFESKPSAVKGPAPQSHPESFYHCLPESP